MPPSAKRTIARPCLLARRAVAGGPLCAVGQKRPCCPIATGLRCLRPNRGLEWGTSQDRRVRRRSSGVDVGASRIDMTALEIAISAAAAFAPRGAEWEMPERAELEVA